MHIIGGILWLGMPVIALCAIALIVIFTWRRDFIRAVLVLMVACFLLFFMYHISLSIIFMDGMGPA
jgi:uncharacterized membrane protein